MGLQKSWSSSFSRCESNHNVIPALLAYADLATKYQLSSQIMLSHVTLQRVLARGKLTPRVLQVFKATEHELLLQQITVRGVEGDNQLG